MTTFIYLLICPLDGLLKYVGKSNNPDKRLKDHCLDFRCMDLQKAAWIKKLKSEKKRPILIIIDEVDSDDWKFWEEWWCQYFKGLGFKLFNNRAKNGLTFANGTTFKKGNRPWNYGKKTMKHLKQPKNSKTCGHHCVAMVAGVPAKKVISIIGHERATRTKELAAAIGELELFCANRAKRFKQFVDVLPRICILKIHFKKVKHTHWVVFNNGIIYDPGHECTYAFCKEHFDIMGQRATSFIDIKKSEDEEDDLPF